MCVCVFGWSRMCVCVCALYKYLLRRNHRNDWNVRANALHAQMITHINVYIFVYINNMFKYTYRWSCRLNALEHIPQTYFRSSLCVSLCLASAEALPKILLHTCFVVVVVVWVGIRVNRKWKQLGTHIFGFL